jgi:glycerol kinase
MGCFSNEIHSGIESGTTGSRAVLLGQDGRVHGSAQTSFEQIYPPPVWVVNNPTAEIWPTQFGGLMDALAQADVQVDSIAAIGIIDQRETTILWDRNTS